MSIYAGKKEHFRECLCLLMGEDVRITGGIRVVKDEQTQSLDLVLHEESGYKDVGFTTA